MFEKLLKEWANEQGFDGWSQDHAAVLRNLTKWLNIHAVEQPLAPDGETHLCGGKYYTDKVLGEVCCRCQAPRR